MSDEVSQKLPMARGQDLSPLVALFLLLTEFATVVKSCHPTSKELHICFNIYLERDFTFIETIIDGQRRLGYGSRRRVLLEGPDLENICRQIGELQTCYEDLAVECDTYWQLGRYLTLMNAFNGSYIFLCGNTTNNMRDLLLNSACAIKAGPYLTECSRSGIQWFTSWKKIFRMQADSEELCTSIKYYKECLLLKLRAICGEEAALVYIRFLDTWIEHWCEGVITYRVSGAFTRSTESSVTARFGKMSSAAESFMLCKFSFFCIIMYISLIISLAKHSL